MKVIYALPILFSTIFANEAAVALTEREPVILTDANVDAVMSKSELVFVAFVAEWCHFSRMLSPVWKNTAKEITKQFPEEKITLAIVQTDKGGGNLGTKHSVNKYPTMKLFRRGTVSKREYRGQRSVEAFTSYLSDQMSSPVVVFEKNDDFEKGGNSVEGKAVPRMNRVSERNVVGYFENKHSTAYETFEALAGNLKDDCKFWAGVGEGTKEERFSGDNIVFKPKGQGNSDQVFMGDITNSKLLMQWVHDKCVPLVRQITFQNGEELTEEGLPFVILFHKKEDTKSLADYQSAIEREVIDQRGKVNFLHADCQQFSHPLFHLGKSVNDCPVIAIDSFKHMYNFPKFQDIHVPNKFKRFIDDLHSGKLHREFHDGPDKVTNPPQLQIGEEKKITDKPSDAPVVEEATKVVVEVVKREAGQDPDKAELVVKTVPIETLEDKQDDIKDNRPIESQFAKLQPSHLKYSMKMKDEL
jgi:endoplasmic reticulum resident protein 44